MVKHIILWQLKDELSPEEKISVKAGIKNGLESLAGKIPGLLEIKVNCCGLSSSNADALKNYATHPEHVAVADSAVCPFTKTRLCLDFEA